jgi:small-conductance mechanosensitive channel
MDWMNDLPLWARPWAWTAMTVGGAYVGGHLINLLIIPRLVHLASRTSGTWDDIVIEELKKRVPFWALLVGAWLALGHWELGDEDGRALVLAHQALVVAAGVSITLAFSAIFSRLVVAYQQDIAPDVPVTGLTQNLVRIVVLIVGLLMIANALGLEITAALTALGVGGLAVALALQEPLSNLFAGLFISLAGQVRVGDYIELEGGHAGFVVDLDWRATRIRVPSNNIIIVPNAKLSQATVTNYGLPEKEMSILVAAGVDYASDLAHVEAVTKEVGREVLKEIEGGVPDWEPLIRYHTFADSSINFNVVLRAKQFTDQFLLRHEFIKRLHVRYEKEGIGIPFPIRTLASREPIPVRIEQSGPDR